MEDHEQEQEREHHNISDDLKVFREGMPLSFDDPIKGRVEVYDEESGLVTLYVSDKEVADALNVMTQDGGFFYTADILNDMQEVIAVKFEKDPDD
jgi:hypothetical protein